MQEKKLNTLLEILNYSAELLKNSGIKDARLNIELMLCDVLNCDRIKLYLDFDKPLSKNETDQFKLYLRRRLNKEPLQYILGKTVFFGYEIFVDKNVLIPRPDTELLVESILNDIFDSKKEFINILEIGTGSGCIIVAISKELDKKNISYKIKSIDISERALEIAFKNIKTNNLQLKNIELKCEDFYDLDHMTESFDYIVSNPPYISSDEIPKLDDEIKNFEPLSALTDFDDGFKFYNKLFKLIKDSGNNTRVFLEIGYLHFDRLNLMLNENCLNNVEFYKDYNDIYRVLKIN